MKVAVAGAAGLVGQNLIARLKTLRRYDLVALDKHKTNSAVLRSLHPDIAVVEADLADDGNWRREIEAADALILLQAQIGGVDPEQFRRNNILSTERLLAAARVGKRCQYVVHVSSSVVNSAATDLYTESKKSQEALVATSGFPHVILRPTLMFGWFDRKHLGWLRRFMDKSPLFPIPGAGNYLRQPLYGGDFAAICAASLDRRIEGVFNISGLEKILYVDLIRMIKEVAGAKAHIVNIPYGLFHFLLATYAVFDRNPPFTTQQLRALATPDLFEVIDWPGIFSVTATPLRAALEETFLNATYGSIALEF